MRLKELAVAALCCASLIVPAVAQTSTHPGVKPAASTPAAASANAATQSSTAVPSAAHPVNINTASAAELRKLPQIGKQRASDIIGGRPYKSPEDLVTKKILTKGVYERIKDKIIS